MGDPWTGGSLLVVGLTALATNLGVIAHILGLLAATWIAIALVRTPPLHTTQTRSGPSQPPNRA
jgi:hypothetical protein